MSITRLKVQAKVGNWDEALSDALKCVELKPDFVKGYSRLGGAYHGLLDYEAASTAYRKGLEIDPANQACKSGLTETENAYAGGSKRMISSSPCFGYLVWCFAQRCVSVPPLS